MKLAFFNIDKMLTWVPGKVTRIRCAMNFFGGRLRVVAVYDEIMEN